MINKFDFSKLFLSLRLSFFTVKDFLVWILLPLLLGYLVATQLIAAPSVAIAYIDTDIWYGSVPYMVAQLELAAQDDDVKAVVIQVDCPGGDVAGSEQLYMEILNLRKQKPVVISIDTLAASGGYYSAIAGDYLYAKPSSIIGNVGVIGYLPERTFVDEELFATGPYKLTGGTRDEIEWQIEVLKRQFVASVRAQRGSGLKMTDARIGQGEIFLGLEAVEAGLIDEIGSRSQAIEHAADLAGLRSYGVVELPEVLWEKYNEEDTGETTAQSPLPAETWVGAADPVTGLRTLPPGFYMLYYPHQEGRLPQR